MGKKKTHKKKKKAIKKIGYNLKTLILAVGVIMIWRGIWNLLDYYLIPDTFIFSNVLALLLGILILSLNDNQLDELGVSK